MNGCGGGGINKENMLSEKTFENSSVAVKSE
jgi:hypothetical protein